MWRAFPRSRKLFYHPNAVVTAALVGFVSIGEWERERGSGTNNIGHIPRCETAIAGFRRLMPHLQRQQTVQRMDETKSGSSMKDRYNVEETPLGEGSFGKVYRARDRHTGEVVAVKEISKRITDHISFQNEINALLHLRQQNGHPNICGLREHFAQDDDSDDENYFLVLDMVAGGEMFDHLVARGPYSEADAARLVREVASALNFMHGVGIVHGDLKPENLMLSSTDADQAAIKIVDFGCASIATTTPEQRCSTSHTPAYSPPEIITSQRRDRLDPSFDMWSLGVILHIMLTGVHPFDTEGGATDEEIQEAISSSQHRGPINKEFTSHLSTEAVELMKRLLQWNPADRTTAYELLKSSWVRGETAPTEKISGSDTRLAAFKAIQSDLEVEAFSHMVAFSTDSTKKCSLLQHAFQKFHEGWGREQETHDDEALSFSGYATLLSENLKNRYFHKQEVVCQEGDTGDSMFFINSGTVEVRSKDGLTSAKLKSGDFFGEGVLLKPESKRNATVHCLTPVHLIEVDKDCFEKYVASGGEDLTVNLREIFRSRNRQRANSFLRMQKSSGELEVKENDYVYREGDSGNVLFLLKEGRVATSAKSHTVFHVEPGSIFGEQALVFDTQRHMTAKCVRGPCKMLTIPAHSFLSSLNAEPQLRQSFLEICFRREFQKVICLTTGMSFPQNKTQLRNVFDALDKNKSGVLEMANIRGAVKRIDPDLSEDDILTVLHSLDLCENGEVSWTEFKRIFEIS